MDKPDSLMGSLLEAAKRLSNLEDEQERLGAKLFGGRPQDTAGESNPEISVASLTQRILKSITGLETELGRQHAAIGDLNAPPQVQGRAAVGY